jgi:hypothetical protein
MAGRKHEKIFEKYPELVFCGEEEPGHLPLT